MPINVSDQGSIQIIGLNLHNLRDFSLKLPKGRLVVVTGVSGSGKTSLVYDAIFAEANRRFTQHLRDRLPVEQSRPDCQAISGLSPAIALQQGLVRFAARSTVGTICDVYDLLRVLLARCGDFFCPKCGEKILPWEVDKMVREIIAQAGSNSIYLFAEVSCGLREENIDIVQQLQKKGFTKIRLNGELLSLEENLVVAAEDVVEVLIDRIVPDEGINARLAESLELALKLSREFIGRERVVCSLQNRHPQNGASTVAETIFSRNLECTKCDFTFSVSAPTSVSPALFSFNSLLGVCPACEGLGGASSNSTCRECAGLRVNQLARAIRLGDLRLTDLLQAPVSQVLAKLESLSFSGARRVVFQSVFAEIRARLQMFSSLGLAYLPLGQSGHQLSAGEAQRLRLIAHLGSQLSGLIYILDEPSMGLHAADMQGLTKALFELRDLGNTILVVDHDPQIIRQADFVVEIGPGAGIEGGRVVFAGTVAELLKHDSSATGQHLSVAECSAKRRKKSNELLRLEGQSYGNIVDLKVELPLNSLLAVCGISGSGKSNFVHGLLQPYLKTLSRGSSKKPMFSRIVQLHQGPLARSPRSTPATYLGVFDQLRELYASTPDARVLGYEAARFSYNTPGGRCEPCRGAGVKIIELDFLPPLEVPCEYCQGLRFNPQTCSVLYRGLSIADVLQSSAAQLLPIFSPIPKIAAKLQILQEVGLSYLPLGQAATTLSGGEAQRLRLARELAPGVNALTEAQRNFYLLDEPSSGLHNSEIKRLIALFSRLVERGHTVLYIEHDLQLIAAADYCLEFGPGAGVEGGRVVFAGTPSDLKEADTITAKCLRAYRGISPGRPN